METRDTMTEATQTSTQKGLTEEMNRKVTAYRVAINVAGALREFTEMGQARVDTYGNDVDVWPEAEDKESEAEIARLITGKLTQFLGLIPKSKKSYSGDSLIAFFNVKHGTHEVRVEVNRFRGMNCKLVQKEVWEEGRPAQPATPGRMVTKTVIECDESRG